MNKQRERYAANIVLPEIGMAGQEKLLASRILLVGVGGLGSAAGLYLAAAGVGVITLMDADKVERGNLQRQVLHSTADIGRPKVESAADKLRALNPEITVRTICENLTRANSRGVIKDHEFVIDATDNLESKFMVADVCHEIGKACSHGGVSAFVGHAMTVQPGVTACYRCVFSEAAETGGGRTGGTLGVVPAIIGAVQAAEALKYLLAIGVLLANRILTVDVLTMKIRCVNVMRNADCPLCAQ